MRLLVRTWNVFHGNAFPPRRAGYLRRMVELAVADDPDVLCLQEVPVWAVRRLQGWAGRPSFGAVARLPFRAGPMSAWVTRSHQGFFRSGLAGQANAILVAGRHAARDLGHEQISEHPRERRLVHAVHVAPQGAPVGVVVGNLHASNEFGDPSVPRGAAQRAAAVLAPVAGPGEPRGRAGDFNVGDPGLEGFSTPGDGIDHVLLRGATPVEVTVWPTDRRTVGGIVLSDHPPVDVVLGLAS
jgi:endonuclease/exonuclease/phosphatase family metal-dependent hydrolase